MIEMTYRNRKEYSDVRERARKEKIRKYNEIIEYKIGKIESTAKNRIAALRRLLR